MMGREDCSDDVSASGSALADLTNTNRKRGISLVTGKFVISNGTGMKIENIAENERYSKRTRKGSGDPLVREEKASGFTTLFEFTNRENIIGKASSKRTGDGQNKCLSPLKSRQLYQKTGSSINDGIKKGKEVPNVLNPGVHLIRCSIRELNEVIGIGDSYISSIAATKEYEGGGNKSIAVPGVGQKDRTFSAGVIENGIQVDAVGVKENAKEVGNISALNFVSEKSMQRQTSKATSSENNTFFQEHSNKSSFDASSPLCELSSQTPCNTEGVHSMANFGSDPKSFTARLNPCSLQNCSCPSCLKAACIWADLLYQDARGRLNEVKKTRREARILVGKSFIRDVGLESNENGASKFKKFTKPEFDLMERWRSLLLHTENSLVSEGTKLEEDIARLRKLREQFMKDMEKNTGNFSI